VSRSIAGRSTTYSYSSVRQRASGAMRDAARYETLVTRDRGTAVALLRDAALDGVALRAGARAAAVAVSRPGAFAALPTRTEFAAILDG